MNTSKEEIKLGIIEHVGDILNFFYTDEGMSDDEIEDISIQSATLAQVITDSLNIEIKEIISEKEIIIKINLGDVESFIQALLSKNLVDD